MTRRIPLFRRVLAAALALFTVIALIIGAVAAAELDASLTGEFASKGTAIARSIASSAVDLLLTRDASTLQATVDQFLEIAGVGYIVVADQDGEILSHTFVPVVPEPIRQAAGRPRGDRVSEEVVVTEIDLPGRGRYLDVAAPILAGVAGVVHVGMDRAAIAADVRAAVRSQAVILAAIFGASLALTWVFVRRTARPLQALTGYVTRMSESGFSALDADPDVERLAGAPRDEIGDLARAFSAMAAALRRHIDDLQRARDELAAYSHSLEERVEARTRELLERNRAVEQALEQLRRAQEQIVAQEKLASLGALTAGVAHEIKNPLNFVNNFAQVSVELLDELDAALSPPGGALPPPEALELTALVRGNLEKIAEHGRRADSIVRSMLLHSRARPGERTAVEVNALVREYVGLAYHGVRANDPAFQARLDLRLDRSVGRITAAPQDLGRALLNILTNACHALAERQRREGAAYVPALTVETADRGDRVEIRIRDNGPGIPDAVRARIFEPFFTTKPAGAGTGLGLSIARELVVSHGGTIEVETTPGEGTEFVVTIGRTG